MTQQHVTHGHGNANDIPTLMHETINSLADLGKSMIRRDVRIVQLFVLLVGSYIDS